MSETIHWHRADRNGKREYPLESGRYLCCFKGGAIETFDYDELEDYNCEFWNGKRDDCVTHWAVLPDGPEELFMFKCEHCGIEWAVNDCVTSGVTTKICNKCANKEEQA